MDGKAIIKTALSLTILIWACSSLGIVGVFLCIVFIPSINA